VSDSRRLYAHTPPPGTDRWHLLADHLRGTAGLAGRFAEPFGGHEVAYALGLVHDVGKASCVWQDRLAAVAGSGGRVGVDHKVVGTEAAERLGLGPFAAAVWGHHGGLIDTPTLRQVVAARRGEFPQSVASAEALVEQVLPELAVLARVTVPQAWRSGASNVGEMALRLVFSALVDADFLDTSAHFAGLDAPRVRADADFGRLFERFEKRRVEMLSVREAAPVHEVRDRVYADCLAAAERGPGMFRLPAPTGAGKTLAGAGFALRHASVHARRRVVVAVPFLTITEQNAGVYRGLLDDDGDAQPVVLEHHSGVDLDQAGGWARLAAENWDAPFVVTTFVRLFESLFGRKPSGMRRVHRLAGSVIILDEVQALPYAMLVPILDGLRLLVDHFGATVLLSSATQPAFWDLPPFVGLPVVDVIADGPRLVSELKRVRFCWQLEPQPTLADIAAQAASQSSAMVVVNTTADARSVYESWRGTVPAGAAFHLSTRMCPEHRRRVLASVRARLRKAEPVLLVSTQLIEAGVDVDFPVVLRAMAPADSLLQAAGRANREGRLEQPGRVVVFDPVDGGQPPAYKALIGEARRLFGPDKADPDHLPALESYYRGVYSVLNLDDQGHVGQRIQQARRRWQFQTVADGPLVGESGSAARDRRAAFRIIADEAISVVTPQGAPTVAKRRELEDLIEQVRTAAAPGMADLRRLQPYTTNLHPAVARANAGVMDLLAPILGADVRAGALVEWRGGYDADTGIDLDPRVEEFVL
jgi:CRISPR-associated endonuclease/helicase Cas3